jgi:O-antigen/teichoic acid export membrane protein
VIRTASSTDPAEQAKEGTRSSSAAAADSSVAPARGSTGRLVLKNTLFLSLAQAASMPLSVLLNAIQGRYLGPVALGQMYLGTSFNAFGFVPVEWGQSGSLPALVAADRSRAGRLLGTSLVWRCGMSVVAYGTLNLACRLLGYGPDLQPVIALLWACYTVGTLTNACQHTINGFERTDVAAYRQGLDQVGSLVFVLPILILGGNLHQALLGFFGACLVSFAYTWWAVRRAGVGPLSVDRQSLLELLSRGTPFVFLGIATILQLNVDAVFLSKLTSADVVGWHAAARRLIGVLIFPVNALIGALYPTLCRLHGSDKEEFHKTVTGALRGTSLLVIPVALSCALFPDIGTSIYSRSAFGPTSDNLRILSLFLFLLYFTMPLGICLMASGRQRIWAVVQALSILVNVVLDPLLVPWFQRHAGNGGLGICVATVASEVFVLVVGLVLVPRRLFDRPFWRSFMLALGAGLAMVVVARLLRSLNPFMVAPIALLTYFGALWASGGLDRDFLALLWPRRALKLPR